MAQGRGFDEYSSSQFESSFAPDGTQAPPPLPVAPDPLAGLVAAGVGSDAGSGSITAGSDTVWEGIARPVEPDSEAVRKAVEAALAEEDTVAGPPAQAPRPSTKRGRGPQQSSGVPRASVTRQAARRSAAPAPPRGSAGVVPRQAAPTRARTAAQTSSARVQRPTRAPGEKPSTKSGSGAGCLGAFVTLIVVIAVVVVVLLLHG